MAGPLQAVVLCALALSCVDISNAEVNGNCNSHILLEYVTKLVSVFSYRACWSSECTTGSIHG